MSKCRVVNLTKGNIIATEIFLANTFFSRFKGLLGRKEVGEQEGILLTPCSSIHCFGMKFNIDVVFIDANGNVVGLNEKVKPGEIVRCIKAKSVLEMKEGTIKNKEIEIGDRLSY